MADVDYGEIRVSVSFYTGLFGGYSGAYKPYMKSRCGNIQHGF